MALVSVGFNHIYIFILYSFVVKLGLEDEKEDGKD